MKKWELLPKNVLWILILVVSLLVHGCSQSSSITGPTAPGMGVDLTGFITSWTDALGNPMSLEGIVRIRETGMQTGITPDGRFQFSSMPTGMWTLVFRHSSGVEATLQMPMQKPGEMHITVEIQGSICNLQEQHYRHGDQDELHGMIIELGNNAFTLHAVGDWFTVRYSAATRWDGLNGPEDLEVGLHVEVEGDWVDDKTVDADRIERMDAHQDEMPHQEWCGMIMQVGTNWFWMHGAQIYYDENTRFLNMNGPQALQVGMMVETETEWQADHWYAKQVDRTDHCDRMDDHE